jgi:hypothetical protein
MHRNDDSHGLDCRESPAVRMGNKCMESEIGEVAEMIEGR